MMRGIDFTSWQTVLSTLLGLCIVTLVMVGLRLVVMQTVQKRRERENRQINERLRTLIAAYKTLGGSFTGDLAVDPAHRRDTQALRARTAGAVPDPALDASTGKADDPPGSERRRRVRDPVEAALSDVILLGTEEQVALAVAAANDLVAGRPVHTAEIVVSLRTFIRDVLDLDPMPTALVMPRQGPSRPASGARGAGRGEAGDKTGSRGGGSGGGGGGGGVDGGGGGAGIGFETHDPHGSSP